MSKIYIVGLGPGDRQFMTPQAVKALQTADCVIGYSFYLDLIKDLIEGKKTAGTGMKKERERAAKAFALAEEGHTVAVVSSGDAGVYGMAPLLWEMKDKEQKDVEIEVVPGISAMMAAGSQLGAPLGHDFCAISMSDLLTPWSVIEKRVKAAAAADFITAIYNPVSKERFWQLLRTKELFLQHRSPDTPVGIARQVCRDEQHIRVIKLSELDASMGDMFTTIIIGNSQTKSIGDKMYTPRGYYSKTIQGQANVGRAIMHDSFHQILEEIGEHGLDLQNLWVALHIMHTTANTTLYKNVCSTSDTVKKLHELFYSGKPPVIITDVTMITQGIRKKLVEELGIKVKCYLTDERVAEMAKKRGITRSQAGIRLAVEEHPDALFAFGNAPTALIELIKLIRKGAANPVGVIGAPVGFVNVKESKWQLKYGCPQIPQIILEGRHGGSNVAATIINAILSFADAKEINPGAGI